MGDCVCTILSSAAVGAIVAVIGMTLWNRRKRRVLNQNRIRPWTSKGRLYHTASFTSARCTWFIEELGVGDHIDIQPYNPYTASAEEAEWYLKNVNRTGKVPALQVDSTILTESASICMYMASAYDAFLPPRDKEPDYYNWIVQAAVVFDPTCRALYRQLQKTPSDAQDRDVITSSLQTYAAIANKLNSHLETNTFICGNEFTAADIMVGYNVMWMTVIRGGLLLQDYTNVKDYLVRLKARKAFKAGMGTAREWVNISQWEPASKEE